MLPVVFDLDGTLIDSLPTIAQAGNALLADEGRAPRAVADYAAFVGRGERVFLERLIAAEGLVASDFDRLLPPFLVHYRRAARATRLMPGAGKAISRLRAAGHAIALCTNKPSGPLEDTLAAAGLADAFDCVVAGDTLPVRKPDPAPLRHILAELGAGTCIYVGDSETDAETATNAAVPFVLYTEGIRVTEVHDIPHDVAFNDFGMLPGICAKLSGQD